MSDPAASMEILEDEDSETFFAKGHVEPSAFLDAVNLHLADIEADVFPLWEEIDVRHLWFRWTDADDECAEGMVVCAPDDPAAEPFTSIALDAAADPAPSAQGPKTDPYDDPEYRRTHSLSGSMLGSPQYPDNREGRRRLARTWKRYKR